MADKTNLDGAMRDDEELGEGRMHDEAVHHGAGSNVLVDGARSRVHVHRHNAVVRLALHHHDRQRRRLESGDGVLQLGECLDECASLLLDDLKSFS